MRFFLPTNLLIRFVIRVKANQYKSKAIKQVKVNYINGFNRYLYKYRRIEVVKGNEIKTTTGNDTRPDDHFAAAVAAASRQQSWDGKTYKKNTQSALY